jgi:Family of unknown function (DUF6599)
MRITLVLPVFLLLGTAVSAQQYLSCHLVPGWEAAGTMREYTADNLYEYMDGNAESYLLYGFERMQGITCASGEKKLVIDVSEMENPDLAYGMFASNRDPNQSITNIAMGGQIQPRRASFAKGKYYVEMAASPEGDQSAALKAFATKMEPLLKGRSTPPEPLEWFPKDNLTSVRLVPESVLGLKQLKRGYVAKYAQAQAFVVLEASPESAADVFKKVRARFPDASPTEVGDESFQAKTQYLDGICIFRKGRYVAGYANLPDSQQAVGQAIKLATRIP